MRAILILNCTINGVPFMSICKFTYMLRANDVGNANLRRDVRQHGISIMFCLPNKYYLHVICDNFIVLNSKITMPNNV